MRVTLLALFAIVAIFSCGKEEKNEPAAVVESTIPFKKNVLVEDFTGTWCGWCPRVIYAIDLLEKETDQAVIVGIHQRDQFHVDVPALLDFINLSGYPTAKLDRRTTWRAPENASVGQVVSKTQGKHPGVGLAMAVNETNGEVSIDIKAKFGIAYENPKLVVFAIEDSLIGTQENYTDFYGGEDKIASLVHNHVLRKVVSKSVLGDPIQDAIAVDTEISASYEFSLKQRGGLTLKKDQTSFVAFVVDSKGYVLNARKAKIGEDQSYQIE